MIFECAVAQLLSDVQTDNENKINYIKIKICFNCVI